MVYFIPRFDLQKRYLYESSCLLFIGFGLPLYQLVFPLLTLFVFRKLPLQELGVNIHDISICAIIEELSTYFTKNKPISYLVHQLPILQVMQECSTRKYRIFPIKRRGRLFKTQPRRPGVYLGLGVYFLNAFFQYWKFIEPRTKLQQKRSKKCETMSSTLSHISESGKLFIKKKKTSLTETVIELFSTLRFSVHETRTNKQQTYCASNL